MQLTAETVEAAVSMLAKIVEQTESNEGEQNSAVLSTIANYLMELATFVKKSNMKSNVSENV